MKPVTATLSDRAALPVGGRVRPPNPAADRATLVGYAVAVGALVTLGLWVRHGEIGLATGPGGVDTAIGQIAALLGTYAVLVQLLLMSRIAPLERAIGLDRLAVWHRWTGFSAVWLLVAHVWFTTLGYSKGLRISLWHQSTNFIAHYADVLMAWVGFAMFLAVGFTSVRIARKKLKRETWYFVHLYAYLAIALTFAHQLAVGSDFSSDRAARIWWVGLYVLTFGAIAWWRVLRPLVLNSRHRLYVHHVQLEAPGVVSVHVRGRQLDQLQAQPGQFFLWRFMTPSGWWQAHPFSLSAAPAKNKMRVTIKALGDHTRRLQGVRKGTRIFVEGPFGTFTSARRTRRKVLMIAGGIGITPIRALLDTIGPRDDVVLLYRVVREQDTIFADELQQFAQRANVRLHIIPGAEVGDDQTDLLSIPALQRGVPDITERDCFVCGPPGLVDALRRRLTAIGVPKSRLHYERFEL